MYVIYGSIYHLPQMLAYIPYMDPMGYKRHNHPAWWPYKKKCPQSHQSEQNDHDESLAPSLKHIRSVLDGLILGAHIS